eukprot:scaffold6163_cov78-Cylindrotheca_fusiformis.AAC.5
MIFHFQHKEPPCRTGHLQQFTRFRKIAGKSTILTDQSFYFHFTQHQLNIYINTELSTTLYLDTSHLAQEVPSKGPCSTTQVTQGKIARQVNDSNRSRLCIPFHIMAACTTRIHHAQEKASNCAPRRDTTTLNTAQHHPTSFLGRMDETHLPGGILRMIVESNPIVAQKRNVATLNTL